VLVDNLRVAVYFGGKLYGFFCAGVVSFLAVQKLHMRKVDERGWVFFLFGATVIAWEWMEEAFVFVSLLCQILAATAVHGRCFFGFFFLAPAWEWRSPPKPIKCLFVEWRTLSVETMGCI
jgi:hypothetical protein